MYNKKVISILLSTVIASSTSLNITLSNINVFADKPTYKNNLQSESENILLHMGEYKDDNGILSFPNASGKLKEATYLRFDFNRNAYNDVTVLYTLNSQEESVTGKNVKIPIKNQTELDEVLKSLKINTNGNKKLGFNVLLGGLPILKSIEGKPSRLYKPEKAIDGNNDTFYGAINQNNSTFTILFEDKTYIENILIKANKNFTIEGLKDNVWKNIGNSTTDSVEINGKKKINVEKDIYDGIIIKQKHSGVDSCTINEIEFNNGSVEEKINYNLNVCSLDLGNKVVNEDGSVSFKDFNAKGNEVKLLISFEKDSDKNKISYMQNKQAVEKKGDCEIDVNNETELNEILESIKIYHDNKTENSVSISLITNNNNSIENVPEGIIAEGGAFDNVHTAENVFSGSNSFFISNSSNTLTLKNTKDIYLNGAAFLNGNSQIIIKGLKNGKWSDIGTHNSNEFEMIDLKSGYYDEVKFTSSSTLDIRNLYLRYSDIKEDIKLGIKEEVADKIDMGKMEYSNGKITFKDATGRIQDKANISISSKTNIEINYTLNGEEITKDGKEIIVEDLTQETLDEFLRNFSISYNEYEGCELDISLLGNPSTITQNYSIPQIQGDLELNLGDYENDGNGNVVFPDAKGLLCRKGNININFEKGFSNDIEIKYKLNDTEYTKKQNNLSIQLSNQEELEEVLKTLKIRCDSNLEYNLNVTLAEERYIPLGTVSDKPEVLNGKGWYCGNSGSTATLTFNSPVKMSAVSLTKTSGVDNNFKIKGLKDGIWKNIGSFIISYPNYDYFSTREIDVQRDTYDAISIRYSVGNGWGSANVSKLGFLDKVSSNIKIKPDINLRVSLVDNLEKVNLKWNSDLEAYAYNIYVKKKDDKNWNLFKSVTSNINEIDDYNIKDSVAPLVPEHKIQLDGLKKGIQLNSDDLGSEYSYYINAIDKDGNKIGTSNVENINVQSDFKAFVYEVNNSSTAPTELKNKSDGFIALRELIDKNYLHVASVDNTGNISDIKTIPILGLFIDEPPVINVPGDNSLKQNDKVDINEGVSAIDEIDGDLTSKINTKIISPKGEIVSDIDTNILGNWVVEYKVTDSKGQTTEYIRKINVIKNINLKLNVGELITTSKFTQFPNAKIESKEDEKVNGIKMYFSNEFNDSMKVHYTLDGIEKVTTNRSIIIDDELTIKDAENLIKSIKIDHDNSKKFNFNIVLSSNDAESIIYNYENNHYYKFIYSKGISLEDAKKEASKQEFLGNKGYLVKIDSESEKEVLSMLTDQYFWNDTSTDNKEKNGFVVEFGLEDKLPSPDTINIFDYESIINIEPFKSKQDIIINTLVDKKENKVILDWNDIKDVSYYKVLQKKNDIGDFKVISSDKNESYFEDIEGKDVNKPTAPIHKLYDTGIKQGLKFDSEDIATKIEYYIEGISKYGDVTHTSNKKMVEIKSGLEGFSYEVSDNPTPSSNLGNTINSTDGFISAKELASKKYVHIISVDKAGNKSQIVTLPIIGLFIDNPPILQVGGNISIEQNKEYNIMENILATDDYDGDLTKDIKVNIKNPAGEIVDKFDTSSLGKWTIQYSVKDSKEQESKAEKVITVKENLDYLNVNLGEPNKTRFCTEFPNASVTNNSDKKINGIKLYISSGYNESIVINYTDKGIKKSFKGQQIILDDSYTTEEANNLVKSLKIEHDNTTDFDFNIRVGNSLTEDIVYNSQNKHYYKFVNASGIKWEDARKEAEKQELKGVKGHLLTIESDEEQSVINSMSPQCIWINLKKLDGKWVYIIGDEIKEATYFNWIAGEPNNQSGIGMPEDYVQSIKENNGKWNDIPGDTTLPGLLPKFKVDGYIVEFAVNKEISLLNTYEDTAHIKKMISNQDIVLNSVNDDKNNYINLSWNKYKNAEYYKVFRRELNSDSDEFETILENTKENCIKDTNGKDITPPIYDFSLIFDKEMNSRLEFHAEEVGTTYEYKIESYDKDNYQTAYSNISKSTVTSKFKGYIYVVDEKPDTELDNTINNIDGKFSFENVTYNTYLHIKAIDEQGNATKTKHIKLADETHNNEPRIVVKGKNRVIKTGEEFDKLDGVKAYDLEDGDLTDKLVIEGEVNNQVKGVYEIKYSVEDNKGLKSEVIVKVHVTGNMDLNIEEQEKDELLISWNEVKNAVKYKLYRTDVNGYDFEEKGVFTDTTFIDKSANDVSSPIITYLNEVIIGEETSKIGRLTILSKNIIKLVDKEINKNSEQNTELKLLARDLASIYRYFVEAIDINGNVVNSSEIKNASVSVGLAGFNYIIDDKEDTEAANFVNAKNVSDIDIFNSKFKFLHVKAIDSNGNVSQTAHHLISGKYDTNHIPVIKGVNTIRVKEGDKFDPLKGVSAYDTEDGDLTSKIEVEGKVDSNINGKYLLTYKVEDSQGNKREVKRNIIVYADMEIKVTPDYEKNNLVVSWEENPLKDKVFYEIRKYDYEIGSYKTIGYTEDLSFVDKNAKDIYGSKINNVHGSDMDTDELEDKITLNISAADVGASEKYQVRTRLKEDNLILRDMTNEEGHEWGITGSLSGVVKSFKWKLSNKREDDLKSGMITTSISSNTIEFEHKGYKYIHIMPIDSYDNEGDIVHYEIGKPPVEEVIEPPAIDIAGVPVINGVSTATIMVGDEFKIMKGVTAKDYRGQDLTNFIKVKGFVNRYEKGEYELVYSVTDFKGQETSRACKVRVIDYSEQLPDSKPNEINSPPEVNFWDEDYIYTGEKYGEDRILNGIRVIDAEDGDITHKVTYETDLDINEVGTYVILYSVSDNNDNKVKFTRVVYVIQKGEDKPVGNNDENWQNGRWARIKTYNKYLNLGDTFNIKSGVYAYDDVDGDITSKIKASGIVNTIKPGAYNVTYKVTNSDNNTTVAGATIFVKDGGWDNNNGEEPNPSPDWGNNDNDDSHNNHIPNRPDQPTQDEDDINGDKLPGVDDDAGEDDNKDIFIDKDGNKVFPDGTIEKPDGTEIKPNEEGEKPNVDDDGNIIVPPDSVIVKPDGTIVIPPDGAIIKPDGTIIMNEEENKHNSTNKDNEVETNNVTNIKNEKDKKEGQKPEPNVKNVNPETGDKGIIASIAIFTTSLVVYLFLNRKKNK
ncbi:immunoglobulin-like domain-containing protein [Clostridioides difficile]|uniref:immunoglobulin-like domain-containing protein n=1 Tax=Clostridioides difficile TaxID=1496 RepID=UPI001432D392|nr:immunoglobulin-like domain-containing protein [Clostridioides difficile]